MTVSQSTAPLYGRSHMIRHMIVTYSILKSHDSHMTLKNLHEEYKSICHFHNHASKKAPRMADLKQAFA